MKKPLLLIFAIVLLAVGCNSNPQEPPQTTAVNQATANTPTPTTQTSYCIGSSSTEIGSEIYPIDPKYGNLNELGQIFTANDCGSVRLKEVTGDNDYDLGSSLTLKANPTTSLLGVLQSIGFTCATKNTGANSCREWQLNKTVKITDILKLQPYAALFETDDCINCG